VERGTGAAAQVPDISVVVCTHTPRRLALLRECLESLTAGSQRPAEVIVVVDSNPALLQRLRAGDFAGVVVLPSDGSGVSMARNTGIAAARGEVVAFIDDDAVADPDWLRAIGRPFADPSVVAVGGRILPRWEVPNRTLPDELLWVVGCTYAGHPVRPQPVTRPIACNMAARRDALVAAGGFPREFGPSGPVAKSHSNEEIALAVELRRKYGQTCIWYVPDALVHHFVPAARGTWAYLWHRCVAEGKSKADVRLQFGSQALGFDRSYARHTLLPAIGRYAARAATRRDRAAAVLALAGAGGLFVTATAYGARTVSRRLGWARLGLARLGLARLDRGRS
jgi:glycosyltransferase involved in cell wall biosynthesis